jgi:hypothetical protein
MTKKVDEIEHYQMIHKNNSILIMDVSFSNKKQELDRLYNMFKNITLIDHHIYPDNFFTDYSKIVLNYDKSKSAGLLANEFFKNTGKNKNLDLLTRICDVYDIWQVDEKEFDFSQNLNNIFWDIGMEKFCTDVVKSGYSLPSYYSDSIKVINKKIEDGVNKLEQKNLIHRFDKITVIFSDEYFNDIQIKEMKKGQHLLINAMTYGIIKIRVSKYSPYTDEMLKELSLITSGEEAIGHKLAWTYKIKETSFENIMNEIQRIVKETYRICY